MMSKTTLLQQNCFLILLLVSTINAGYPLKILGLFPHPGISHFHFFHPIMRGLAEAGHDVTVVSHFPDRSPPAHYKDIPLTGVDKLTDSVDLRVFENAAFHNLMQEFMILHEWAKQACNHTLKTKALIHLVQKSVQFDVIILEQFNSDCMMAVAHMLKAPIIGLSSCAMLPWHYERMGAPIIPSYIPATFLGHSEDMNLYERTLNWFTFHFFKILYNYMTTPAIDAIVQHKFGHDVPSVGDLAKETSLFFVNQHFSLSGAKPLPPSVIELGGIHIQKAKPLDIELQRILDNAEHGVVFISWGSMIRADSMSDEKRDSILRAAGRLKQKIIWKWENETLENKPANMHIAKWLPQRDILCHPNVKVFMTHAGLMGSSEAAYCGVPVIATPMYGDQFLNAASMEQRGMGLVLPFNQISENNVVKSIKRILDKKSYMDNAKLVSHSFKHRPHTALQTAIWWVEYVAKTNGAPLTKSSSVYMSRFSYYSIDVYLLLSFIAIVVVFSWIWVIRSLYRVAKAPKDEKVKKR